MVFFDIYKRLWRQFKKDIKKQLVFLLLIMNINAIAEFFSVISIVPLLTAMVEPEELYKLKFIKILIDYFNINNPEELILLTTILFVSVTALTAIIKLFKSYYVSRLTCRIGSTLSIDSFEKIINQDYQVFTSVNSSKYLNIITGFVNSTIDGINKFFEICSSTLVIILILAGLFSVNFIMSISMALSFAFVFTSVLYIFRKKLNYYGKINAEYSQKIIKYIQESTGAIRDIIIDNSQTYFSINFGNIVKKYFSIRFKTEFLGAAPRSIIEAVSISSIAIVAFVFSKNSNTSIIPTLGTIALGSQKLIPALNSFYGSIINIKFNYLPIMSLLDVLDIENNNIRQLPSKKLFNLKDNIHFKNVYFNYTSSKKVVIKNLNLIINKGERIGIVGKTGSGKSTIIELFLHLLKPTKGNIYIDGFDLNKYKYSKELIGWRSIIAYVPQDIFLIDSNFIENIALGLKSNDIDLERVKSACDSAQISDFIESCERGYHTQLGERGIQLSGGQKQRVGIARALYKKSQILILDEATSSLDSTTEKNVMRSIASFNPNLTILTIAHRLSTISNYDRLVYLKNGIIEAIGTPDEITKLIN